MYKMLSQRPNKILSYPMQTRIFDDTINQSLNIYWLKYLVFKNKGRMIKVITNKTLSVIYICILVSQIIPTLTCQF